MPASSFPCHQLLSIRRPPSRLLKSPLAGPCDDMGVFHSSGTVVSPASAPRPSSALGSLEQRLVSGNPCPLTPRDPIDPQISTELVGAPDGFGSQPTIGEDLALKTPSPHGLTTQLPCHSILTDSAQSRGIPLSPVPIHTSCFPKISSQQSSDSQHLFQTSGQSLQQLQHWNRGMFNQAHHFTVTGNFIDGNITNFNATASNEFMEKLLEKTIPGAEFDSSDRDPPPRCHPGTRSAILNRCLDFISNCNGQKKMRWVVGGAGVGKSAIMQNVAESPKLPLDSHHASIFFSVNGRDDGTKAVMTLSYQLAAKSNFYRQLIEQEIARDPSLLRSSLAKQFLKLITEPFIFNSQMNSVGRVLIIIDGLDECKNPHTQQELLRLISGLCLKYPSSPIAWLIASRPETHITSFFSGAEVMPACEKEEILVDSDEARSDVERFLRERLTMIKEASDSLDPQWPEEQILWKLASAAGGLFAYAHTLIRYISDSTVGSPASQLSDVLKVIDEHPMPDVPQEEHPMAFLDALYTRILSNVPPKVMRNTRKLLLALASGWDSSMSKFHDNSNFIVLCNWLGMTPDDAYAALNCLRAVLNVPPRNKAHEVELKPFHKSFIDYVSDFSRSRLFPDIEHEARQLMTRCTFRILKEAPDGIDFGKVDYTTFYGILARGPGTGDRISLTWSVDKNTGHCTSRPRVRQFETQRASRFDDMGHELSGSKVGYRDVTHDFQRLETKHAFVESGETDYGVDDYPFTGDILLLRGAADEAGWNDTKARLNIYKLATSTVVVGMQQGDLHFQDEFCIRLPTNQFKMHGPITFPFFEFRDLVFDESRRDEFMMRGILKQMPIKTIDVSSLFNKTKLRFRCAATTPTIPPNAWESSCCHEREGQWGGNDVDWTTTFSNCTFCIERLKDQFESLKARCPDHTVLTLPTLSKLCGVELRFVDPEDGVPEWTYWYWCY